MVDLCSLVYSKRSKRPVRWVLAVPNDSDIQSVKDLEGKKIATEGVGLVDFAVTGLLSYALNGHATELNSHPDPDSADGTFVRWDRSR